MEKIKNMKELGYWLFALIFNSCRIFPVRGNKVVLFNGHNRGLNGNLLEIKQKIIQRAPETTFVFMAKRDLFHGSSLACRIKGAVRFFLLLPYHMATAEKIFLNDNFLPFSHCRPSKQTQIVQLWHGAGAFKKFGLSTETDETVKAQVCRANQRLTHLFVTSRKVIPYYQEAFSIPAEKIFATGIPVTDIYTAAETADEAKARFYALYPKLQGKKLLLYTPTFRRSMEENQKLMEKFPMEKIYRALGEDWIIGIKLHPKYQEFPVKETPYCLNLTDYPQITDLFLAADLLITDYSSTIVEYVLLDRPIVLYAFDLKAYDRGFYRDYETTVPGIVAHDERELLKAVVQEQKDSGRRREFIRMQYDHIDGKASERILDILYSAGAESVN